MPEDIQLSHLNTRGEKAHSNVLTVDDDIPPLHLNLNPASKTLKRKLILYLVIEALISTIVYVKYDVIMEFHSLLAPALLGSSTAAFAQSINQYSKSKFSASKIYKFLLWGVINGVLTVLWINMLNFQFETVLYRIIIDQMIGAPTFQIVYNILSAIWENGDISSIMLPVHMRSLKYSYCFWPFFSTLAFLFLPPEAFFPANCVANLIWNLILSKLSS